MKQNTTALLNDFMTEFANNTGLAPESSHPKRYLWTDAFAVCNYLELYNRTNDKKYLNLALTLIYQVHHILGKYSPANEKSGWISGLDMDNGENHPTQGGLRIGKEMNERGPNEPYNESREWDRDGQYYHYLTKWMHALNNTSTITGDTKYTKWAMELAKTAHKKFTYLPNHGIRKRMYWKMSIDLNRPLVPSMGQHDPLDGYVTYCEIQNEMDNLDLTDNNEKPLSYEKKDMKKICQGMSMVTDDPLGLGGLLSDATQITQLINNGYNLFELLETILDAAIVGIRSYISSNPMELSTNYRLAFRELGLSIGIKGLIIIKDLINNKPKISGKSLENRLNELDNYTYLAETIEKFWLDENNRKTRNWVEHKDINTVMLGTALAPNGFLKI
ncbi:MAG: hypothetical protein WCF28_11520 [Methanobacterium sp.]|uniref:hypothetical protein n=1 Tax=Methanobacterium sp. TaxID=2164 RepID=UPI003C73D6D4